MGTKDEMKFIAAGMTRRAFERNGRCVKVPVPGREDAAVGQNRAEYENCSAVERLGLKCFPKAYSLSEDGTELEEELMERAELGVAVEAMAGEILEKAGFDLRGNEKRTSLSIVAFALGYALSEAGKAGLDTYEKFASYYANRHARVQVDDFDAVTFYYDFKRRSAISLVAWLTSAAGAKENKLASVLIQLVKFTFATGGNFALEELWNVRQWGFSKDGSLVALDAGFSREVQKSGHYTRCGITPLGGGVKTTMPADGSMTFNGEPLAGITDPNGGRVRCKFFTSKNTEYILSDGNMARRIKKAGLSDDGLYSWTDRMSFVGRETVFDVMKRIGENNDRQLPTKVDSDWKSWMTLSSINADGEWEVSYSTNDISSEPELGRHVLEFNFDGDGIVKGYHPGHDVSYIQWRRQ